MKKIALNIVLGLTVASSFAIAQNSALVIGCCSEYDKLNNIRPLYGTTNDAKAFKDFLVKSSNVPKSRVVYLTNTKATKNRIISSLRAMLNDKTLHRGDRLYIYYSGHGSSPSDNAYFGKKIRNDKELLKFVTNSTALVPYDTDPKHLKETLIITKRDFKPLFKKLDSRGVKIVWITDACYSGNAYRSSSNNQKSKYALLGYPNDSSHTGSVYYNNLLFYGAALSTLPTAEHRYKGKMRGDFSYALEECLKQPNNQGYIRHKDLKKCLNANFSNSEIQHNYYPLKNDSRLDNQIVMRVPKSMRSHQTPSSIKERLFKLQNNQPLLEATIRSLNSKSEVIKSFCNRENLSIDLQRHNLNYILAFTKDKKGKVIMLQPDVKHPMVGNRVVETEVKSPFGKDKVKIFATNDKTIYQTALKFANKPEGVLSSSEIKKIYQALKRSGNFRTANLTVETISRDINECKKGD